MQKPKVLMLALFLFLLAPVVLAQTLGTTNLVEGSAAGSDSVVLAVNGAWTATTNTTWLHLSAGSQNGASSTNVVFTFDANSGATRIGTLTIAGQTLAITQAGSSYVAITNVTTLVSSGLNVPEGVAVDGVGNVFIADTYNNVIKKWSVANGSVSTLVSSLGRPFGVAVDGAGNVYIADTLNNAIKKWTAANSNVTTLVITGLFPEGVAVDGMTNLYFSKSWPPAMIYKWSATNGALTMLVVSNSTTPLSSPQGVAVDGAGNVYLTDFNREAVLKWNATSSNVTTMVASGLNSPAGVAVDGSGNVYIADSNNNAIKKRSAVNGIVTSIYSGLNWPNGVAVDGAGNVYIADTSNNAIKELSHAFVDFTARTEMPAAGSDALPVVLPATANLAGPFAPVSNSAWLTLNGVTNGVVSFSYTANTSATSRTANITLLGQTIAVTQAAVQPPLITGFSILGNGSYHFGFTSNPGVPFTVWSTTNLSVPLTNWTLLGSPTNTGAGLYEFTDLTATQRGQGFYRVSSP